MYAEKVAQPGQWLEAVDGAVLGDCYGVKLHIIADSCSSIEVQSWEVMARNALRLDEAIQAPAVSRTEKRNILLISCNAVYDPAGARNHWIPAWFQEQLTPEAWFHLAMEKPIEEARQARQLKLQISHMLEQQASDENRMKLEDQEWEFSRLTALTSMRKKYREEGICFSEVAADGNCLALSFKQLVLGATATSTKGSQEIRDALKEGWREKSLEATWQSLFNFFVKETGHNTTPEKKKLDMQQVSTPQKRTPPEKVAVERVGAARPVAPREPEATKELKLPSSKREEKYWENQMMVVSNRELVSEEAWERANAYQRTRCRKKVATLQEKRAEALKRHLADHGVTYIEWLRVHRKMSTIARAADCTHGGYKAFCAILGKGLEISCQACLVLMNTAQITPQGVSEAAANTGEEPEEVALDKVSAEEEYKRSIEFLESQAPILEVVRGAEKGYDLAFRCTICPTSTQKAGRVNTIFLPRLKTVKHFVNQHCNSATHRGNLSRLKKERTERECPGLDLDAADCKLSSLQEEYQLWISFSTMGTASHSYWTDHSSGKFFMRHRECPKTFAEQGSCCSLCLRLGDSRHGRKYVRRFMTKHHAATLLSMRLFSTEAEVEAYVSEFNSATFGKIYRESLSKLQALDLGALQKFVRKSFASLHGKNALSRDFYALVVRPGLKVHVGTASGDVPIVAEKFLASLQTGDVTEMQKVNLAIAKAAATGKLDANPFVQGILIKCVRSLEKAERGVFSTRGRLQAKVTEAERSLVADAALTLCMSAGSSKGLAVELGQNACPPRYFLDDLLEHSLPCPALALLTDRKDQLQENLDIIDQRFPRTEGMTSRRLLCALDHTYLQKAIQQVKLGGKRGFVGGVWYPDDESRAFMDLEHLPEDTALTKQAGLMLECLTWDPAAPKKHVFSLASMPMSLEPLRKDIRNKGNIDMLHIAGYILENGAHLIRGICFDGHLANAYIREALRGHFKCSKEEDLQKVCFFKDVEYVAFPENCLPRLPARLCTYKGEAVWAVQGPCG